MTMWQGNGQEMGGKLGTSCALESPTLANEESQRGD